MSNTDDNIELSIAYAIKKITKAQTELATYTTILGQLYRAKEADYDLVEPLASDPIESFGSVELDEAHAIVPGEYRRHLRAQFESQKATEERERRDNATRIQFLSTRLEELQAVEAEAKQEKEEGEKKLPAKQYNHHPPSWQVPVGKSERFRQARHKAQQWAEQRKPNPNTWCSPANQKAIRDRKEKVLRQQQLENRQVQYASEKLSTANVKASARAKQLDGIIEEFQRAQQRAEALPTKEEIARLDTIGLVKHPSFDSASGEGDY